MNAQKKGGYPDDESPQKCLEYLAMCLSCHEAGVRIVGNLRVCDALRAIQSLEDVVAAARICSQGHALDKDRTYYAVPDNDMGELIAALAALQQSEVIKD